MKRILFLVLLIFVIFSISCEETNLKPEVSHKPNIILIMADDMGYECLSTYGSTSYQTPVLDAMANEGIKFNNCVSQPLCTPSRVKIMTGLYNYRNYDLFGHLNSNSYTFGNLLRDAGYATCITGKWQLNGLAYTDQIEDWNDATKPNKLGFDEYCLWQLTQNARLGGRFSDPLIEQNGKLLERNKDAYGPDIFADYAIDFIERKKDEPFFIYYPMVLVHSPFVPTPDSREWQSESERTKQDVRYFKDMVAYTDKIVGKFQAKLQQLKIDDNTIIIFTGDNGTHTAITSTTTDRMVKGAKGNTTDGGTHVPLIISWPDKIKKGFVYDGLIEFSDFFTTFADIVDKEVESDGKSFYSLLSGQDDQERETAFVHYDPRWGQNVNKFRSQFARNENYKLYHDGRFYNLKNDILEKSPIQNDSLSAEEGVIKTELENEINRHPKMD
jgi:arylsulfatase A-like enzyme